MGGIISDYDNELMERIERIRVKNGFSQETMAEKMGVEITQYKRYIYKRTKIPAEKVACLIETLSLDTDYVLIGSKRGARQFIKYLSVANDLEIAELLGEIAQIYKDKYYKKNETDFIDRDFNLIERNRR